jgi:serine/threonine protein kinase
MGKIHRDVKGGNILLTEQGQVKLGTFMISVITVTMKCINFAISYSRFWRFGNFDINIFKA